MRAPSQDLRPIPPAAPSSSRAISATMVIALHVAIIWALASGLAHQMIELLPQNVQATVIPPDVKNQPPPPPPPKFQQPPPFVPPPDVTVDLTTTTSSNAIAAQTSQKGITAPSLIGARGGICDSLYPPLANKMGWVGNVMVEVTVNTEGMPEGAHVTAESGHPELDAAAVECVNTKFRWKPAMSPNGEIIAVKKLYKVLFRPPRG